MRNSQNGMASSWDVRDLQRRVDSLEQELRDKNNVIAQLNDRVAMNSASRQSGLFSQSVIRLSCVRYA